MDMADIAAAGGSINAMMNVLKSIVGLRDSAAFLSKQTELQRLLVDSLEKAIASRDAQSLQLDRINALQKEINDLKEWEAEKQTYELVTLPRGSLAFMLQPNARGASPPHWLCPNCFAQCKKSFLLPKLNTSTFDALYACTPCGSSIVLPARAKPEWQDQTA